MKKTGIFTAFAAVSLLLLAQADAVELPGEIGNPPAPVAAPAPVAVEQEPGANCTTNIVADVPNGVDWREVYMLKGDDGYAWQRAIISSPKEKLSLKEGENFKIVGTADPNAEVQFFLFNNAPDDKPLQKPAHSVCMSGGTADENGLFGIDINARVIWDTVGGDLAIDAFFRMDDLWEQQTEQSTNQNYLIGTHMPLTTVKVEAQSKVTEGCQTLCQGYKDSSGLQEVVVIDPTRFSDEILNGNFTPVKDAPTALGKFGQTFYAGTKDSKKANQSELQILTNKAIVVEMLKQFLLGQRGLELNQGLPMITGANILSGLQPGNTYAPQVQQLIQALHDVMTGAFGSPQREAGLDFLHNLFRNEIKCTAPQCVAPTRNIYHEIFPPSRPEETWQNDLLDVLLLWTSRLETNQCILDGDQVSEELKKNFLDQGHHHRIIIDCSWYMTYTHGYSSPAIIVHDAGEVTLSPDFNNVRIMTSDVKFSGAHGWKFAAGKKHPVYYRYETEAPIVATLETEASCIAPDQISAYADHLTSALDLNADENMMLVKELEAQLTADSLYSLHIADPADIATRFAWKINGIPANIFQLFFQVEENGCSEPTFTEPQSAILEASKAIRDGFETGFVNR